MNATHKSQINKNLAEESKKKLIIDFEDVDYIFEVQDETSSRLRMDILLQGKGNRARKLDNGTLLNVTIPKMQFGVVMDHYNGVGIVTQRIFRKEENKLRFVVQFDKFDPMGRHPFQDVPSRLHPSQSYETKLSFIVSKD